MDWIAPEALEYLPLLILVTIGILIGLVFLGLSSALGKLVGKYNKAKYNVYECGVPEVGTGRQQFSVRYYLVAIVFLLFDVEVAFMIPWALSFKELSEYGPYMLVLMFLFVDVLLAGYFYLLKRDAFGWD